MRSNLPIAAVFAALFATSTANAQESEVSPAAPMPDEASETAAVVDPREQAIKAVQANLDAYRKADMRAFLDTFADDARVFSGGYMATGRKEIEDMYRMTFAMEIPPVRVVESGFEGERLYLTLVFVHEGGGEQCCAYGEYIVKDGKIALMYAY